MTAHLRSKGIELAEKKEKIYHQVPLISMLLATSVRKLTIPVVFFCENYNGTNAMSRTTPLFLFIKDIRHRPTALEFLGVGLPFECAVALAAVLHVLDIGFLESSKQRLPM